MEPSTFFLQDSLSLDHTFPALPTAALDWISERVWRRAHAIPVYVSSVSAIVLVVRALASALYTGDRPPHLDLTNEHGRTPRPHSTTHTQAHGGNVIFAIEALRLLGCLELLRVSTSRFLVTQGLGAPALILETCIVFVRDVFCNFYKSNADPQANRHILLSLRFLL